MIDDRAYVPGDVFHTQVRRVYDGEFGWAVNKRSAGMARVLYEPAHENQAFEDPARRRVRFDLP